jgi:2'-5' RNA ligase
MTAANIRLFVALGVPEDVARALTDIPRTGIEGRWNHPDDLHLTLRFLGDIDPSRVPEIREALGRVRRPPFGVEISGLGFFDQKRGAVLYARADSTRKLNALCGDITDTLTPLGFEFGMREFVPHITLARLKNARGLPQYIDKKGQIRRLGWQAQEFGLMQSGPPDSAGRHYQTLALYPLIP